MDLWISTQKKFQKKFRQFSSVIFDPIENVGFWHQLKSDFQSLELKTQRVLLWDLVNKLYSRLVF